MHYLYKKSYTPKGAANEPNSFPAQCDVKVFAPAPFRLYLPGEKRNRRTALSRLYFWLITAGKYRIFSMRHGQRIVHTSYVVPKCAKFPFLGRRDMEIGPCVTHESVRRRGIYRYMLQYITAHEDYRGADFYMIVRDSNLASIAGIEKAGFRRCGTVVKSRFLKNYRRGAEEHG